MKFLSFIKLPAIIFISLFIMVSQVSAASVNLSGGVAIQGYDPVAYFTDNVAVKGSDAITINHEGATYQFASEAHKQAFVSNPEKYVPQYGGYCAFAVAHGSKASIHPDKFTIVNDKLYLNLNGSVQSMWRKDTSSFISRADDNWPSIQ